MEWFPLMNGIIHSRYNNDDIDSIEGKLIVLKWSWWYQSEVKLKSRGGIKNVILVF